MTKEKAIDILSTLAGYENTVALILDYSVSVQDALHMAIKALEQQPKTGHWEYVQYDSNPNIGNWHCSECGGICTEMHSIEDAYNYCSNCGARMESEETE